MRKRPASAVEPSEAPPAEAPQKKEKTLQPLSSTWQFGRLDAKACAGGAFEDIFKQFALSSSRPVQTVKVITAFPSSLCPLSSLSKHVQQTFPGKFRFKHIAAYVGKLSCLSSSVLCESPAEHVHVNLKDDYCLQHHQKCTHVDPDLFFCQYEVVDDLVLALVRRSVLL